MPGAVLGLYPLYKFDLVATLNHTIWFENNNKSIDINQWTLFDVECMSSCNGTTLNISRYGSDYIHLLVLYSTYSFMGTKFALQRIQ